MYHIIHFFSKDLSNSVLRSPISIKDTQVLENPYSYQARFKIIFRALYVYIINDHKHSVQNPDIVLVHYLNVPYPDDNKMLVTNSVSLWGDKKEWTKEELISQIKPMCKHLILRIFGVEKNIFVRIFLTMIEVSITLQNSN